MEDKADLLVKKATAHFNLGQFQKALEDSERALKLANVMEEKKTQQKTQQELMRFCFFFFFLRTKIHCLITLLQRT